MKININILFWNNGDEQRLKNTKLSWFHLNKFCEYVKESGVEITPFLFDFSEDKCFGDAIHIPYPKDSYKRAEKINKVIDYHSQEECLLSIMDSDLIIRESDYDLLKDLLSVIRNDRFYVFKVDDLNTIDGIDFENNNIDYNSLNFTSRNFEPDLGGLFIMNNQILNNNLFDERFIVWGGEDNKISYELQNKGYKKILLPVVPLHLPHKHALLKKDEIQYMKQREILGL